MIYNKKIRSILSGTLPAGGRYDYAVIHKNQPAIQDKVSVVYYSNFIKVIDRDGVIRSAFDYGDIVEVRITPNVIRDLDPDPMWGGTAVELSVRHDDDPRGISYTVKFTV